MYRFWSVFFGILPIACLALCFAAPGMGWWFPKNISTFGGEIDDLFNIIMVITTFTFIVCNILLVTFMWKYADKGDDRKAMYTHGNHKLEVAWTAATALLLAFIAFSQMDIWVRVKFPESSSDVTTTAQVLARQFEWRMTYPGDDGVRNTPDDIHSNGELVVPVHTKVKIELVAQDVLHSFFLPNLRVKQDAVPGLKTPVWFEAEETGTFDLVCAELCGWGHYKMKGRLRVVTKEQYEAWKTKQAAASAAVTESAGDD